MNSMSMVEYKNIQTSYLRGQNTIQPDLFIGCRMFFGCSWNILINISSRIKCLEFVSNLNCARIY